MYDKNSKIIDRREQLRVKLKSLAAEAKLIRLEERRIRHGQLREELYLHRIHVVRTAARDAHVAYGLIRGRTYGQIEPLCYSAPNWDAVEKMVCKFGSQEMRTLIKANGFYETCVEVAGTVLNVSMAA
jgi:hypothetical protein